LEILPVVVQGLDVATASNNFPLPPRQNLFFGRNSRLVAQLPPISIMKLNPDAALKKDALYALLYEALETEKGGILVYETALRCAINDELVEEWKEYLKQTREHVNVVTEVLTKLGLNPDQDTPGRSVVRHAGTSLVKTMEIALMAGKPEAAQVVAAECVVQAETKDHMNWHLIGVASEALRGEEKKLLKEAYEAVEDEEDEHVYHTTGWARELHLQALGLPAQLPPVEEEKNVKTEIEAAEVRKERNETLMREDKGSNGEEKGREKGSRNEGPGSAKSKRQTRKPAA
jgi:hypothetical protein